MYPFEVNKLCTDILSLIQPFDTPTTATDVQNDETDATIGRQAVDDELERDDTDRTFNVKTTQGRRKPASSPLLSCQNVRSDRKRERGRLFDRPARIGGADLRNGRT